LYFALRSSGGEFANEVNAMAEDVVKAGRGETPSPDWNPGAPDGLNFTTPLARSELAPLGAHPEILVTAVALEAYAPQQPATRRVRALALVFPDGRVRYTSLTYMLVQDASYVTYRPFPRGNDRERILAEAVEHLITDLAENCEDVHLVTSDDLESFPARLRG